MSCVARSAACRPLRWSLVLVLGQALLVSGVRAQQGEVAGVHDPHLIRQGATYYVFHTGVGLPVRRSKDLLTWEKNGPVFRETPEWARNEIPGVDHLWAPDISYHNGMYQLYYSVSTFGSQRSCIGLAVNRTLDPASPDFRWEDRGKVLESVPGRDDFNAIDANFALDADGHPWLAFGSFWTGIKLRRLDPDTRLLSTRDTRTLAIAARPSNTAVEAAFLLRRGDWHYLFVSFDFACRGTASTYKILVGRSPRIEGPYVDRDGLPLLDGNASLVIRSVGPVRGPGHCSVLRDGDRHWLAHHYYDARENGVPKLQIRPLLWDDAGWPLAGEPAGEPAAATPATPLGSWRYLLDYRSRDVLVEFLEDGVLRATRGRGRWELDGSRLTLSWSPDPAGRSSADTCILSADGSWYVGRSSGGEIVRGVRP
jgi:arabinan endo-1,5-alpha-L-arabinosidase